MVAIIYDLTLSLSIHFQSNLLQNFNNQTFLTSSSLLIKFQLNILLAIWVAPIAGLFIYWSTFVSILFFLKTPNYLYMWYSLFLPHQALWCSLQLYIPFQKLVDRVTSGSQSLYSVWKCHVMLWLAQDLAEKVYERAQ
jgi:hypothetical protein